MSDDWQVPVDLADRLRRTDYSEAWAREIEHTAQVRAVLQDLIAELRAHSDHAVPVDTLVLESWADRAEQRLKEVTGHE